MESKTPTRRQFLRRAPAAALLTAARSTPAAQPAITIDANRPGPRVSPSLYGIFFEEINHAGDGGLYAEMVRDRSFAGQDSNPAWTLRTSGGAQARMAFDSEHPVNPAQPRALRIEVAEAAGGVAAVNQGYWGMGLRQGARYRLSLFARANAAFHGDLEARLETADGRSLGAARIGGLDAEWKRFAVTLSSSAAEPAGRLAIAVTAPGSVWLSVVSLFPEDTWKGRANGLRPDLAEMLAALRPAFLRFPGGCYVEGGNYVRDAFRWKQSIGDIATRPGHSNATWGYRSTDGLGYHEYLQLAEDLGAAALFVVNVGMAHRDVVPMDQLTEWVDEALDAIEYANGPVASKWGAVRARNGHPDPFGLRYLEIGNENGGPNYNQRYAVFYKAIKAKYPEMILIANSPVTSAPIDVIDHHIYATPEVLRRNASRYDTYSRQSPPVFVGEYAVNQRVGKGNLRAALAEAAYMMGLERNSDAVRMAAYAPLFYHVNDRRWPVNLIGFDTARAFGSPSYWVQYLFARHRPDTVLPCTVDAPKEKLSMAIERGAVGLGTWNTEAEFRDVEVTQGGKVLLASDFSNGAPGWRALRGDWQVRDGAYRQMSPAQDTRAIAGDPGWTDYTIRVKARKIAGAEGFLVLFRVKDNNNWFWLNVGGWGNSVTAVERSYNRAKMRLPGSGPGGIETGRWYDIRVDVQGPRIQAFLDGKSILTIADAYGEMALPLMEAAAGRVDKSGEIVLKVVNFAEEPRTASLHIDGAGSAAFGTAIVLTSASPEDENTVEEPRRVAPVTQAVSGLGREFAYTFPPHSLTVLRF